ncbi:MAG: cyclase family protein [Bacteroidetes bacterium]|nr:MAG: cyclase family protein [Bacteroidota bacterium]
MRLIVENIGVIDTEKPLDISLVLVNNDSNPKAWYVDNPRFEPVMANGFTGSVEQGGSVNFRNIYFNPHGHGTHTECVGHITNEVYSVNRTLKNFFFLAQVITVEPEIRTNADDGIKDLVITRKALNGIHFMENAEAIIIRTLPNTEDKKSKNYSNTNPAFLDLDTIELLAPDRIKHLLIDTPSVDRENDGGLLSFHHKFWNTGGEIRFDRTITELVYVNNEIQDGLYVLELQMASFENDAAPSRPVLYRIESK